MRIVCFFGPDGSGKSTLAKALAESLKGRGLRFRIYWMRGTHTIASILARFLSRFNSFKGSDNPYYGITLPPKLRLPWMLIEFSSILPHYLLRKFLSLFHYVIGDRGVLDFIVWIIVTLDHPRFLNSLLGVFLAGLAAMETAIYITADPHVLRKRAPNTPYSFLLKELLCYNVLAKYYASHIIDTTNRTPKESLGELLKCLRKP